MGGKEEDVEPVFGLLRGAHRGIERQPDTLSQPPPRSMDEDIDAAEGLGPEIETQGAGKEFALEDELVRPHTSGSETPPKPHTGAWATAGGSQEPSSTWWSKNLAACLVGLEGNRLARAATTSPTTMTGWLARRPTRVQRKGGAPAGGPPQADGLLRG